MQEKNNGIRPGRVDLDQVNLSARASLDVVPAREFLARLDPGKDFDTCFLGPSEKSVRNRISWLKSAVNTDALLNREQQSVVKQWITHFEGGYGGGVKTVELATYINSCRG